MKTLGLFKREIWEYGAGASSNQHCHVMRIYDLARFDEQRNLTGSSLHHFFPCCREGKQRRQGSALRIDSAVAEQDQLWTAGEAGLYLLPNPVQMCLCTGDSGFCRESAINHFDGGKFFFQDHQLPGIDKRRGKRNPPVQNCLQRHHVAFA